MKIKEFRYILFKFKEVMNRILPPYSHKLQDEDWKGVVVSFWMANLPEKVIHAQKEALKRYVPKNVKVEQILTNKSHAESIDDFLKKRKFKNIIILDIDCIPVSRQAIERVMISLE